MFDMMCYVFARVLYITGSVVCAQAVSRHATIRAPRDRTWPGRTYEWMAEARCSSKGIKLNVNSNQERQPQQRPAA